MKGGKSNGDLTHTERSSRACDSNLNGDFISPKNKKEACRDRTKATRAKTDTQERRGLTSSSANLLYHETIYENNHDGNTYLTITRLGILFVLSIQKKEDRDRDRKI